MVQARPQTDHALKTARLPLMKSALVAAALVFGLGCARAESIADQRFDDRIQLANTDLLLNGVGLRAVAWFKAYAAGLYLAERVATADRAVAAKGPKRVQIKMLVDAPAEEFAKAFNIGIRRNTTAAEQATMGPEMAQFDRLIDEIGTVKKGDVINLDLLPARGVVMSVNGSERGKPIANELLYAGILRIFIGERPVDRKLKDGLLGQKPT